MPDLDPLPGRPHAPVLTPRYDDYAGAVDRARHRRRRHLGVTSAGLASALTVLAFAVSRGGGTYGLEPAPPAAVVHRVDDNPTPTSSSPNPDPPSASPSATPDPARGVVPGPGAASGSSSAAAPEPGDSGTPSASPAAARPVVVRDDVAYDPGTVCDSDPSVVTATGWCLRYDGPTTIRTGSTHGYRLLACRAVGRGAGTLGFETEQQVEFAVYTSARAEWRWSAGYPFPKRATSVTVGASRCARWSVTWDGIGDDGDPVAPGSYSFSPDLLAADWGTGTVMSVGTAYSFTIEE